EQSQGPERLLQGHASPFEHCAGGSWLFL
ncbi:MAG: hypothetical protein, partial [Olavius algarvensis Delta 4 endosymbiont]